MNPKLPVVPLLLSVLYLQNIKGDSGYLSYVKDGCFVRNEAFSCVKYKALKIATKTIFGGVNSNKTIKANEVISLVPLDEASLNETSDDFEDFSMNEPRGFLSEWTELVKYAVKMVREFFRGKGLRVNLPNGARTVEEDNLDDGRGKKKKLAIVVPLLTLLAALKTKLLLLPILLAVMLIKKLLLIAALLLPSLLSTLKACKHHHPMTHYSYFGGSDSADFNSDSNSYSYASGGGYGKDWASNRAYSLSKPRPTPNPVYFTAPGSPA